MNDFLSRQPAGGDTYNITGPHGFVAGFQQHVVQNNSFGLDASKLQPARYAPPAVGTSPDGWFPRLAATGGTRSSR
ncbi:hypothetical protein ABZ921_19075 [Streptomyces atriruber]|uniref:Uncharacterized protein n=1 Tax=Streptomyces atriruber TaxID=545121 RepID=A0ABV3BNZ2_9ACTN